MAPKAPADANLAFLYLCLQKSDYKIIDFKAVGDELNINVNAARMRFTRLRKYIESSDTNAAATAATDAQDAAPATPAKGTKSAKGPAKTPKKNPKTVKKGSGATPAKRKKVEEESEEADEEDSTAQEE